MISVVIPVVDHQEMTETCINTLLDNAIGDVDIIVVDNEGQVPYHSAFGERVIRNDVSPGPYRSLLQGTEQAESDIVLWMHNDVLVHELGWNKRILREFKSDPRLGIAGFFGGRGVQGNGGRMHPEGNMLGKVWGSPQSHHGTILTGTHPAVVFDSLAVIINRNHYNRAEVPNVVPHHWWDRISTLWMVWKGYHALTIGIGFDHGSGQTSIARPEQSRSFAQKWCEENSLPLDGSWDNTMYAAGERFFRDQWRGNFPVQVDVNFYVTWGK